MSEKNKQSAGFDENEEKVLPQIHKKRIKSVREFREIIGSEELLHEIQEQGFGDETNFTNIWDDPADSNEI